MAVFFVCLFLGLILAFTLLPETIVRVVPAWEPLEEAIEVRGEPTLQAADPRRLMVPVRVAQTSIEGSQVLAASGRRPTMNGKAEGWVTLIGRSNGVVKVPRATVVSTSTGIRFETIEDATLQPGGRGAKVQVIALEPGEKSNVKRNEINRVEGPLGRDVDVLNEDEVTGGGPREETVVTREDRERVREMLMARLQEQAAAELKKDKSIRPGDEFLPGSLSFQGLREEYDNEEGAQAKSVTLRVQGQVRGSAVNASEVVAMVERTWQPVLKPGYTVRASTVKLEPPEVKSVDPASGALSLVVRASATAAVRIDRSQVESSIRWMSEPEIVRVLSQRLELAEPPAVIITPDFADRAIRVKVVVDEPGQKRD